MLKQCFFHYGLSTQLSSAIQRLALLCFQSYPCGYSNSPVKKFNFSRSDAACFLGISETFLSEALHYGALFGLLEGVILSPYHAEFSLNPTHRRDLFFACLRLELRKHTISA